ncbi:uncharacterized protein LOC124939538 [Impatiens glandulifera]|uniref:uncharacterized protein LOC124939538 n=1 Tax=Impatiens glandulifera TaxID=253017 RepID=UPI001FB12A06|nr:uncharacterized protein LOC124939538 [Impatiens glandulifera]
MATDISYMNRIIDQYKKESADTTTKFTTAPPMITRDFLGGGGAAAERISLDEDNKHISTELEKDNIEICKFPGTLSLSMDSNYQKCNQIAPKKQLINDLGIVSTTSVYQSVCTLDNVKLALDRVEKETSKKRLITGHQKSSHVDSSLSSFATGCPNCNFYVMISKNNPKCPRCNALVRCPIAMKKPRFDLNLSI